MRSLYAGVVLVAVSGCARPPLGEICPEAAEGELVITEVRGPQSGGDNRGQWFEVYNASDHAIDLRGLRVRFFNLQGEVQSERPILVRAEDLVLDPGAYGTLGHHDPATLPGFVDYTFIVDFFSAPDDADDEGLGFGDTAERRPKDLLNAGRIELEACDVVVDNLRYEDLPTEGTLSLDGALEPSAESNDDPNNFCTDDAEEVIEPGQPQMFFGLPGTPQQENPACPPK